METEIQKHYSTLEDSERVITIKYLEKLFETNRKRTSEVISTDEKISTIAVS